MPCLAPRFLIQLHRALWMWAAIVRTVCRGEPGTGSDQSAGGRFWTRYVVTRLFVRHAAISDRVDSEPPRIFTSGILAIE
jgi:hypothetical protein